ncbi:SUMO-specific isopeptidase USPL1 isoform X2 [Pygocentrus nattereri]|uniref:SUMO-specific isopeptidase USPL1 isoform X2 n=1 Tax=Pygocentrus nattereri TaxID=42514 RepID=UPI00081474F4|nr:SUMO-specific isopeptidase USPL1 isoform X2 [Pygocentrus nattereri]
MHMRSTWKTASPHVGSYGDTASMNGESSGTGPLALAGCLGKNENRREVSGNCPWCSAKGQTVALRSYAINFKESITLCSSPLCLFPLVSRPLEDIRAHLFSAEDIKTSKRKSHLSDSEDPNSSLKRQKKEECDVSEPGDCRVSTELFEEELFANGHEEKAEVGSDVKKTCTEVPAPSSEESELSDSVQTEDYVSSTQDEAGEVPLTDVTTQDLKEMVPSQLHLFWRNKDNLCWLDSLLVALVHLSAFSRAPCENVGLKDHVCSKNCTVGNLCTKYRKTCAYLKSKEQKYQGNVVRVPLDVLRKAEQELEALQLSVFQLLQPKLQCELGQKETPVFALPLLLNTDEWAHSLFHHTGQWEFKCTSCHYTLNTSVEKTLTTFTQLTADWHPLRAVHRTQCSNCHHKNQKRKLFFQRISPVLALHFVEGLPRRDISRYSFDFQGTHYAIKTIIQYNEQLEHFVTWIQQPDGSWLEFDDLKYPNCITHKRFKLPASQLHLVFWEAESRKDCQLPESVPEKHTPIVENSNESVCLQEVTNSVTNDTCIIEALTVNEDKHETVSILDSSIGSTTLLDTFEGLSHSDIVTLTLVEVKVDVEGKPLPKPQETVTQPVEPSVTESSALQVNTSLCQSPSLPKHTSDVECASSKPVAPEIILPSVVKTSAPAPEERLQLSNRLPTPLPSKPSVSNLSFLLHRHSSLQSTPSRVPITAPQPKPDLRCEGNEALPAKPADLFGGFRAKTSPSPVVSGVLRQPLVKLSGGQPTVLLPQKPFSHSVGTAAPVEACEILKPVGKKTMDLSAARPSLSTTDILRLKLMKKLKAKKKKLAKLNRLLAKSEGEVAPRPDSTDLNSPYSVTSSTTVHNSPGYDNFIAELLSPATTSSNLSPDSTGLLEMLTNSQGGETSDSRPQGSLAQAKEDFSAFVLPEPPVNDPSSTSDDFLDELITGSGGQQNVIENADFNALDMFF